MIKGLVPLIMLAIISVPAYAAVSGVPPEVTNYSKDWPLPNHDYGNTRAATNSTINSGNVNSLGVAWSMPIVGITAYGGAASTPLILGNTIYFQDLKSNVYSLDLKTGKVSWAQMFDDTNYGPNGPAVGWGKVFVDRGHYNISALDAKSGKVLWTTRLSYVNTTGIDIQPTIYDGMVYVSTVPGTSDLNWYTAGGIGIIYALDQETGKVRWNFSTVDSPNLWGHPEINSGGGCWYTPAIDTNTGIIYWGIANPAPFPGTKEYPNGSSRPGPNLYTDSMMALNHSTGSMKWFNQVYPHDLYDYDLQIAPVLANGNVSGKQQDIVIGAGKMGKVFGFNRESGALLWSTAVGEHNENDSLDRLPEGVITRTMPSVSGGVETPMAYADGIIYVPVMDKFADWTPTEFVSSTFNFTTGRGGLWAVNTSTGKVQWYKKFNSIDVGGATVVNDLVFTATYDGTIYAFKRDTGENIWTYKAPARINGWPAVSGDTIVWPCGVSGKPSLVAFRLGLSNASQTTTSSAGTNISIVGPVFQNATVATSVSSLNASANLSSSISTEQSKKNIAINLIAKDIAFDKNSITVPAGAHVTVNFDNQDNGIPHNVAFYTDSSASKSIYVGAVITGPKKVTYAFDAPTTPGIYFFRCDVHPTSMTGQFIVQ